MHPFEKVSSKLTCTSNHTVLLISVRLYMHTCTYVTDTAAVSAPYALNIAALCLFLGQAAISNQTVPISVLSLASQLSAASRLIVRFPSGALHGIASRSGAALPSRCRAAQGLHAGVAAAGQALTGVG